MRKLMNMIAVAMMAALLLCVVISCASADEKIYTSPVFKLPANRLTEWVQNQPEKPEEPEDKPEEKPEEPGDEPEGTEDPGKAETPEDTDEPAERPQRAVLIFSSQGSVVTEGEFIILTSELIGYDGLDVSYQWQVDRGDGLGWVNLKGANRSKHTYVAGKDTIKYKWRLIVTYNEK